MKKPAIAFAHRLRRYLGALLALSFGATWWELSPPAPIADPAPAAPEIVASVSIAWGDRVVAYERPVAIVTTAVKARARKPIGRPRRIVPLTVVIEKPPVEPVLQPVSVLPPAVDLPPIELPVIDDPEPPPVKPPRIRPPIITRGSR